jgi:hypothetical protein
MARATAVVAFSPLFAGSSCLASALRKRSGFTWPDYTGRSTSRLSSADESVAFVECCHSTYARCSLGLRPSKACSRDEGVIGRPPVRASERLFRALLSSRSSSALPWCPGPSVLAWAEARFAGEPARLASPCVPDRAAFVAGIEPGELPRWRSDAADPTGTCSRGSVDHEGRRQVPHPVACLHHVCLVILPRFLRCCRPRPRALSALPFVSEDFPGIPVSPARRRSSPVHRCSLLLLRPHPAWAGGRRRQARRRIRPKR